MKINNWHRHKSQDKKLLEKSYSGQRDTKLKKVQFCKKQDVQSPYCIYDFVR